MIIMTKIGKKRGPQKGSVTLIEVLSGSRNLFSSDSFDIIADFKTIRDA